MIPPPIPKQNAQVMDFESPLLMSKPWWMALQGMSLALANRITYGPWADIPAAGQTQNGSLYVATDRGDAVYQLQGDTWVLVVPGTIRLVQADIAATIAPLTTTDEGLLLYVTDFRHTLRWDGAALTWAPGEDGRHDIAMLPVDPDDLTGWQLCDGTTVDYLKGDGTTASYATPDLVSSAANAAYPKLGDPVTGVNPATAPTFSGGSIASAATGITAVTTGPIGTQGNVTVTGAVTVASSLHTHNVSVTDPTHTHTFSGGSIADDGEPQNIVLRPWFRL